MTTREILNLIDGRWVGTPAVIRQNPARPEDMVSRSATADEALVEAAVETAKGAQREWAQQTGPARGGVLLDAAEILRGRAEVVARDLVREEGKTLAEARSEVKRAIDVLRFFGGEGWRSRGDQFPSSVPATMAYTQKCPLGVVAAITPWNFPIAIPAWKIAPALVSGNAVVLKPAELTPVSAWHLVQSLIDAGLPSGVLSLICGKGSTVGEALVTHPDVVAVSFTGSVEVGSCIREKVESRGARVQLEMGGKNPLIVLDDADPMKAAQVAALAAFGLTGQACTATSRIICTPKIMPAFLDHFVALAEGIIVGDGLQEATQMGPVVDHDQFASNCEYIREAEHEGAVRVAGGAEADGLFQRPTIFAEVETHHRLARDEVFGPVVAVLEAADLDAAIDVANDTHFGLAAGVVTNDLNAAMQFANRIEAGVVKVNRPTTGLDLNVPFGGVKNSSSNTFREQGAAALDFYTWSKSIYLGF